MRSALLPLLLAMPSAVAQEPWPLLTQGDLLPGLGEVRFLYDVEVTSDGSWITRGDTETLLDFALRLETPIAFEGLAVTNPPGAEMGAILCVTGDGFGQFASAVLLDNVPVDQDSALYLNGVLIAREGEPIAAGQAVEWLGFTDLWMNDSSELLVRGAVRTGQDLLARLEVSGGIQSALAIVAREGDVPPGQTGGIDLIPATPEAHALSDDGTVLWGARLEDGAAGLDVVYLDDLLILQEGQSAGLPGFAWGDVATAPKHLNASDAWVVTAPAVSGNQVRTLMLRSGGIVRATGDSVASIAPATLTSFGTGGASGPSARLADTGEILWSGSWTDGVRTGRGLFVDERRIVEVGVTQSRGRTITDLRAADIREDGSRVLFVAELDGNSLALLDLDLRSPFEVFCRGDGGAAPGCTSCPCGNDVAPGTDAGCRNSTGRGARLVGSGSVSLSAADLRFEAFDLPPAVGGILISGGRLAPSDPANPCFGLGSGVQSVALDGLRCAVKQVARHGARISDDAGRIGITTPGFGSPDGFHDFAAFVAGTSRAFQLLLRDDPDTVCGTGRNSTQAISLTPTP